MRNVDDAHGGFLAASRAERRHRDLQVQLQLYLALTMRLWAAMRLLIVQSLNYDLGDFELTCASATGLAGQGIPQTLRLSHPMGAGRLILHSEGQRTCLPLLPLLRVHNPSAMVPEVCFFSRVNNDGELSYAFFHQTDFDFQHVAPEVVLEPTSPLRALILRDAAA